MARTVLICRRRTAVFLEQSEGSVQKSTVWKVIRIALWAVAGLVVLLTLAFAGTVIALPGCTQCHASAEFVEQTSARAHASTDCVRCHADTGIPHRLAYGYNLLFGQTLKLAPIDGGPITAIPDSTCRSCHEDMMKTKVTVGGLSMLHSECAEGRRCVDCHSDTAHGTAVSWISTVSMNMCLDCHNTDRVRANCDLCHDEKSEKDRIRSGEWAVTHGSNWQTTHGMGDLDTCAACHPNDYCVRCHGMRLPHNTNFIRSHPAAALVQREQCDVCHKQRFCDSCHGMPMPHPEDFTPRHSKIVGDEGQKKCRRCHVQSDCENCHVRHVHPGGATTPPGSGAK